MVRLTQEKVIKIMSNSSLPVDIIKSDLSLQSYLEQNIIENRKDELTRLKLAKAREIQRRNYLRQKEKQITVTPVASDPVKQ